MIRRCLDAMRCWDMAPPGSRVLVALSGGADSVCLTHLLCALRGRLSIQVGAAHFMHGLRPWKAEEEWTLARQLCDRLGIPFYYGYGDTREYAAAHRLGLEEAARELRYGFLQRAARDGGYGRIATAHHLDDQAETVLLHLVRGAGAGGLSGIPPVRGNVIRPLLEAGRQEIEGYCAEHGLAFAVDETNGGSDCARNLVRNQVMPLLRQISPAAPRQIAAAGRRLRLDEQALAEQAGRLLERAGNGQALRADVLAAAPAALGSRAVRLFWSQRGGQAALQSAHVEAVLGLCQGAGPSRSVRLPGGWEARREYGLLALEKAGAPAAPPPAPLGLGLNRWGEWEIFLGAGAPGAGWRGGSVAADALRPGLQVRARETGDWIQMAFGRKTLKKLMIEEKIPRKSRDSLPILCDNEKVWALFTGKRLVCAHDQGAARLEVAVRRRGEK